jgi:hypothetical protein
VGNIRASVPQTTASVTCVLTRENYFEAPRFVEFCNREFPGLYAVFFSVYKGTNPRFVFSQADCEDFFSNVLPVLDSLLYEESRNLLHETLDEKRRLMDGVRFPKNDEGMCFIALSERVFDPAGREYRCSHLYRDGVEHALPAKHARCLYGCNRRLVAFNDAVGDLLREQN